MRSAVLIAFALTLPALPARGETIVIRPDHCPVGADHPLVIDLGDVEIFSAASEAALGKVLVVYPPLGDGWASARILMRFDYARGLDVPPVDACGSRKLFRQPR